MITQPKHILFLDLETFSEVDIRKAGAHLYARNCEIILFAWAINDEPVEVWDCLNEPMPMRLQKALASPAVLKVAHNQGFDRNVIHHQYAPMDVNEWLDTMVIAYTLALPGKLESMLVALGADLDFQKVADGKRLIRMFCMPQKVSKNQPFERKDTYTDPEDWELFIEYARQDVNSMRWAYHQMPQWVIGFGKPSAIHELELWRLHERINDRGIPIDLDLARAAIILTDEHLDRLNSELYILTGEAADAHSKRDQVLAWVRSRGVDIKGYTKEDLTDLLKLEVPPDVRRVLEIRQEAGRTSTAKYQALIDGTDPDTNRLYGGIQYYGASRTGRSAGRKFQPHNLPHPEIENTDAGAESIINNTVDLLFDESAMAVAVSCVRSAIKSPPGKNLTVSDLANIEGRVLPWLAGEEWKLQAFRDYDTIIGYDSEGKAIRKGPDMYKLTYSRSFGVAIESVGKDERQIGKFQELSLGYQGGVGAFYKQAKKFGTNMMDIYHQVIDGVKTDQLDSALWMVDWIRENRRDLDELNAEEIIGADLVKQGWRVANSDIVSYWYKLEDMVRKAIENQANGQAYSAGPIKAAVRDEKLLILLPSKRPLVYNRPKIKADGSIRYMSHEKGSWRSVDLYGGKIAENVTQAVARDVLMHNMIEIDSREPILFTVHDEIISESDEDTKYGLPWMDSMLAVNPPWSMGLPLAAAGYVSKRYKKD